MRKTNAGQVSRGHVPEFLSDYFPGNYPSHFPGHLLGHFLGHPRGHVAGHVPESFSGHLKSQVHCFFQKGVLSDACCRLGKILCTSVELWNRNEAQGILQNQHPAALRGTSDSRLCPWLFLSAGVRIIIQLIRCVNILSESESEPGSASEPESDLSAA